MSHAITANYKPLNSSEYFQTIWELTRTMLAAGWKYMASGDALAKDTSASAASDRWAVGGGINMAQVGAQTGTNPTIGTPSAGVSVVSGVSGFTTSSVGRFLVIAGAKNANNNGVFRITAQAGTTVSIFNPGAVSESGTNISWTEKQGGGAASVTASGTGGATPGRAIVSGLTGMVAPTTSPQSRGSVGDHLTIIGATTGANNGTFRIVRYISATSVEIDNASATTDASNGSIKWVESSPTAQAYPPSMQGSTGTGSWTVLQGPSMMKIPIGTNVPTGSFRRGEKVTATTSGATGTLLGVVTDSGGGTGFLVIAPRLNGTGSGARGWTSGSTDTITGSISGATVTSSTAVPVEYVMQMVFWKNTQADGHIYLQCVDQSGESASRFSTIAANAAITSTLAPGSSAAGGFPAAGSWVMLGTGNTASVSTGQLKWGYWGSPQSAAGNLHAICANCIEDSTTDADGSWIWAVGSPANSNGSYSGMCFQRVDGSEDGDLNPYVCVFSPGGSAYTQTRTGPSQTVTNAPDFFSAGNSLLAALSFGGATAWAGWRRRGFSSSDAWQQFHGCVLTSNNNAVTQTVTGNAGRTSASFQDAFTKYPFFIVSTNTNQRMRKGYLRWMWITEGGMCNQTFLNGTWVQMSEATTGNVCTLVVGPWDGQTVPLTS